MDGAFYNAPFYFIASSFIIIDPAIATFNDSPYPSFSIEISLSIFFLIEVFIPSDSLPKKGQFFYCSLSFLLSYYYFGLRLIKNTHGLNRFVIQLLDKYLNVCVLRLQNE